MKKLTSLLFGLFLLVALADGVLDIGLGLASAVRSRVDDGRTARYDDVQASRHAEMLALPVRFIPGIGNVYRPTSTPSFTIGAEGERLHPHVTPSEQATRHILLLGASQVFGALNDDAHSLGAVLERLMPGTVVRTFAGPAQDLSASAMVLARRIAAGDRIDRVVVVNGFVDLVDHCSPWSPPPARPRPVLVEIAMRLTDSQRTPRRALPEDGCGTPEGQAAALERLMAEIDGVRQMARRGGLPLTVVLPPVPYIAGADDGSFADLALFRSYQRTLEPIIAQFRYRIVNMDDVVDLSRAFGSGRKGMFVDLGGHYSDAGNQLLASQLAQLLEPGGLSADQKSK
ncbi:hypothetical protein P7L68_04095 (plasmid) [Tistrella mobilis]|uniref:hypothetical protein n=1 Tax=Tistrella mobilis TaxID=171437 RepID=UPI003558F3E1